MIYLLDTNVLSEVVKSRPGEGVSTWMRAQPLRSLFTASICCAEVLGGVSILSAERRKSELETIFG